MPILPFTTVLWYAVFISMILGIFGLRCFNQIHLNQQQSLIKAIIFVIGVFSNQSIKIYTIHLLQSVIVGCLIITGMMIGASYGSGLSSAMIVSQYETPINTMKDLGDKNVEWGATHDSWSFSLTTATSVCIRHYLKTYERVYIYDLFISVRSQESTIIVSCFSKRHSKSTKHQKESWLRC